ncbi:protein of unknown function [Streptomyces murinus]
MRTACGRGTVSTARPASRFASRRARKASYAPTASSRCCTPRLPRGIRCPAGRNRRYRRAARRKNARCPRASRSGRAAVFRTSANSWSKRGPVRAAGSACSAARARTSSTWSSRACWSSPGRFSRLPCRRSRCRTTTRRSTAIRRAATVTRPPQPRSVKWPSGKVSSCSARKVRRYTALHAGSAAPVSPGSSAGAKAPLGAPANSGPTGFTGSPSHQGARSCSTYSTSTPAVSVSRASTAASAPGSSRSSPSRKSTYAPLAARIPALRAPSSPAGGGEWTGFTRGSRPAYPAATSAAGASGASQTGISSRSPKDWPRTESSAWDSRPATPWVGTIMLKRGILLFLSFFLSSCGRVYGATRTRLRTCLYGATRTRSPARPGRPAGRQVGGRLGVGRVEPRGKGTPGGINGVRRSW